MRSSQLFPKRALPVLALVLWSACVAPPVRAQGDYAGLSTEFEAPDQSYALRVPAGWKTIVPGYSDEVAHRLGLIDTDLSVAQARARYRINDLARRFIDDSMFSLRIRATEP